MKEKLCMLNKNILWIRTHWEILVSLLLAILKPISFSMKSLINGRLVEFSIANGSNKIIRILLSWLIFWAILRGIKYLLK